MDMEIETSFQGIRVGNMPLQAVKLPISHNNVVGENTVLQLNILETGVLTLVVQNSSPTRLRLIGDELWTTHVRPPVSKIFSVENLQFSHYSGADRWQKLANMFTSGRKHQNLCMGVLKYADFKKIGNHKIGPMVPAQNWGSMGGGGFYLFCHLTKIIGYISLQF